MRHLRFAPASAILLALCTFIPPLQAADPAAPAPASADHKAEAKAAPPAPYMRTVKVDATTQQLETAARRFERTDGKGPTIWLTSVVHVGNPDYYAALQKHLNAQSLVLFEGVGWPSFTDTDPADDKVLVHRTKSAIRFIAMMASRYQSRHHHAPPTLGLLQQEIAAHSKRMGGFLRAAEHDGWHHPIDYKPDAHADAGFTITSLGADNKPGGKGVDADLTFADQPPLSPEEAEDHTGIQTDMAHGLGLVFQLDGIDYTQKNFRNSDVRMKQIIEDFHAAGGGSRGSADADADADDRGNNDANDPQMKQLLQLLDGSSPMAGVMSFMFKFVGANPKLQALARLVLIDAMGEIKGDMSRAPGLPPAMHELMKKLIQDRNRVVIHNLKKALAEPTPPKSISIFFGAGHMADMQKRLATLHYQPVEDVWYPAITVDTKSTGLTPQQAEAIEAMIKMQMMQMNMQGSNK